MTPHWLTRDEINALVIRRDTIAYPGDRAVFRDLQGRWYHWDEIYVDCCGPFETRESAAEHLMRYCEWLDGADAIVKEGT